MRPGDTLPSGRVIGAPVVGHIGAEGLPAPGDAVDVIRLLHDAFIAGHDSGYAECVRAVEKGATMGELGDWLSEYETRHPPKGVSP